MSKRRAAFLTLGCKVNQYETDAMEEILEKAGYEIVSFKETADVYIINTCSVTNMADRKSRQMIHRAKKNNPDAIIVAAGCYVQAAEEELAKGVKLYCLGDIVHNGMEVERLHEAGLLTIDHEEMKNLHHVKVLLRAHGEPPQTYALAEKNDIEIIDATCPVVLQLQRRIKKQFVSNPDAQIVIFGKKGHAEVLGLVGQTESHAIVVEKFDEVKQLQEMGKLDFSKDIYLYSQTTKSLDEFHRIIDYCQEHIVDGATFKSFDTICRQVANRMPNIANFASKHDVILFVSGRKSSNGKVLFNECKSVNPNSYQIESADEINMDWVKNVKTVGICGATSTPKWLMEEIMNHLKNAIDQSE